MRQQCGPDYPQYQREDSQQPSTPEHCARKQSGGGLLPFFFPHADICGDQSRIHGTSNQQDHEPRYQVRNEERIDSVSAAEVAGDRQLFESGDHLNDHRESTYRDGSLKNAPIRGERRTENVNEWAEIHRFRSLR